MNGHRLLLVEDSETDAELFLLAFRRYPKYEIVVARDANECLRELRRDPRFPLCFVDLSLPGMDGMLLILKIKQDYPAVAVVILTGSKERAIEAAQVDSGAVFFFVKPLDLAQIASVMNLLDVTEAVWKNAKGSGKSWRTNLCGMGGVGFAIYLASQREFPHAIGVGIMAAGLLCAKDEAAARVIPEMLKRKG